MRHLVASTAALTGLASAIQAADPAGSGQDRPNIVLIVADDLAPEWCGFLPEGRGKAFTPSLDKLASEGVVLRNLHSPSPICVPSRFTLMTGLYPSHATNEAFDRETEANDGQTAVGFNTFIRPGDDNLARRLQNAGYSTGAVGKNHVFEVADWQRLNYSTKLDAPGTRDTLVANAKRLERAFHQGGFDYASRLYFGNADADGISALAYHNQDWITEGALEFIDSQQDKPFFLYMATTIPHGPQDAPRSWQADPRITPDGYLAEDNVPHVQPDRASLRQRLEQAGVRGWNRENVLWMDDAVGAIVDRLEQRGRLDNTIIVFVSDHGTSSKGSVYNRGTNTVGLAWKKGGFGAGSESQAALLLTDLMPTILDWCGVRFDASDFDGRDAAKVFSGERSSVRDSLYFEVGYTRAVVKDGFKYIALRFPERAMNMPLDERKRNLDNQIAELTARGRPIPTSDPMAPFSHLSLIPGGADAEQVSVKAHPDYFAPDQLYDLRVDPNEQTNLIDRSEYADRIAALKGLLDERVRALPGTFGEFGGHELVHAEGGK